MDFNTQAKSYFIMIIFSLPVPFVVAGIISRIRKRAKEESISFLKENNNETNLEKFRINSREKALSQNYHKWGLAACVFLFVFLIVMKQTGAHPAKDLIDAIECPAILCGSIYLLVLGGVYRIWRSRFLYELTIDVERKEFKGLIGDRQKEIIFGEKDINKIEESPNTKDFRFYLNDGTWVTWNSAGTDKERLEQILNSIGLTFTVKGFW